MKMIRGVCFLLLMGSLSLSGCAGPPIDPTTTPRLSAPVAKFPGRSSKDRKVVLVNFSNGGSADAEASNAATALEQEVKSLISGAGAEVIDRSLVRGLKDEIMQLENHGLSSYTTSLATDAISGEISGIEVTANFSPAHVYTANGKSYRVAASCSYKISARVLIQLYNLQPLSRTEAINAEGQASGKLNTTARTCPIPAGTRAAWVRAAIGDSIRGKQLSAKKELQNAFASSGLVQQVRMESSGSEPGLVRISLSAGEGARVGSIVNFYSKQEELVFIDDEEVRQLGMSIVASGVVVETTDTVNSWVKVKDRLSVKKISLGDRAIVHYEDDTWLTKLKDVGANLR